MSRIRVVFALTLSFWIATRTAVAQESGHSDNILCIALSLDGKLLATGGVDKSVIVWDVATGKPIRTLDGHADNVNSACFSADGKTLATGSSDNSIMLWDVANGKSLQKLEAQTSDVSFVYLNENGKALLAGTQEDAVLWNTMTKKEYKRYSVPMSALACFAVSKDPRLLIAGCRTREGGAVSIWKIDSGENVRTIKVVDDAVLGVCVHADGKRAYGGAGFGSIVQWNLETGEQTRIAKEFDDTVLFLGLSVDEKKLVAASANGRIKVWDVANWNLLREIKGDGNDGRVYAAAMSADGAYLVTGGTAKSAYLWDISTGKKIRTFKGRNGEVNP